MAARLWETRRWQMAAVAGVAVVVAGVGVGIASADDKSLTTAVSSPPQEAAAAAADDTAGQDVASDTPTGATSTRPSPKKTTRAPAAAKPKAAAAGTPVAVNGRLSVCGVNLCNAAGEAVQLRGMSSHGLQFFPNCVNKNSLDALRNDWNADFIRLSMYVQEGGLETDPEGFTAKVNGLVDDATALGLYAIVDFHILTPGDPNKNLGLAKTFFQNVSSAHSSQDNVIYEIANEPNGVSWDGIKSYADQVIPVIRKNSPDSVVLVGTRGFSSLGLTDGADEQEILDDPVDFKNVMYTFHFYAASHKEDRQAVVARAAKKLPLFVSEFGTQTFTGDGTNDLASATTWLDLLRSLKISYSMWSFSDGKETNSVFKQGACSGTSFSGTDVLTESGNFMRTRIRTASGVE